MFATRQVPYVPQLASGDCAAACLSMVLRHFGCNLALAEVRRACGAGRDGTTLEALARSAERLGLAAKLVKAPAAALPALAPPAILHWQFNHFVVLERASARRAVVLDPGRGRCTVDAAELRRSFTGFALALAPGPSFRRASAGTAILPRLWQAVRVNASAYLLVAMASLTLQLLGLLLPASIHVLVDVVLGSRQVQLLPYLVAAFALAGASRVAITVVRNWLIQTFAFNLDVHLTTRFVEHLAHLPLSFFLARRPGVLLRRAEDSAAIRGFLSGRAFTVLLDAVTVAGFAAMLLYYHLGLGGLIVALGGLRLWSAKVASQRVSAAAAQHLEAAGVENAAVVESLLRFEVVRAMRLEPWLLARIREQTLRRLTAGARSDRIALYAACANVALDGVGLAALLWWGGRGIVDHQIGMGTFTALVTLRALFSSPLENLVRSLPDLHLLQQQLAQLDDVLDEEGEPSGGETLEPGPAAVRFENVSFRYAGEAPFILEDVSFCIEPGDSVLLIGLSGAGKSTLGRLLGGLVEPTRGRVLIDERPIGHYERRGLRRSVAIAPQAPQLFDATVRDNLLLGGPAADDEELWRALEVACLADFVRSLPQHLESRIGQGGLRLSKGQRQRLALARALVGKPALLVLDEFASGLDLETEARIHQNLAQLDCTRIFISHRLSSHPPVDQVLIVKRGAVHALTAVAAPADLAPLLGSEGR
jgi:ATP-binding cassette subfamily B protein